MERFENKKGYQDIITFSQHPSSRRARMLVGDRAAQFAPFSALVGLGEMMQTAAEKRREEVYDIGMKEEMEN